jgi:transaldolase
MKFYLDCADVRQWAMPAGCPPVQGVTTNPTLVMQAGLPVSLAGYLQLVAQAGEARLPELMLQLPRADVGEAAQWLEVLLPAAVQARVRLTIKLPCHPDWQPVLREVQAWGVPTLLTGLSNPVQLLWARAQGASYVAPYVGRLQADGRDVWKLLTQLGDARCHLGNQSIRPVEVSRDDGGIEREQFAVAADAEFD